MINLVYGPSGSGKSTYIYNQIREDLKNGERPILIVPDQQILSAEREIMDISDGISTVDVEILSFRRLANHVFRNLGGLSFNDIDESGRLLIMWRVLREVSPFLKAYSNIDEKNTNFAELILSTINELKQFSITPAMLEKAGEKVKESHKELSDKLHDISFIYGSYQAFFTNEYNDPTDELTRLADTLKGSKFFGANKVYFDSFDGFTPQQYGVINEICLQAKDTYFSLCYDIENTSGVFKTTEKTYKNIKKLANRLSVDTNEVYLNKTYSFMYDDIRYVSQNLWRHDVDKDAFIGDSSHVNTIRCHDKFEECEAIVCDIIKKVRRGVRYKDILVIARDINAYEGIIDSELENNGIPFYMSRRVDITTKPIFKLILAAFAIKNMNWRYNDVISYIKTGLTGLSYDECDILENYSSAWNITGRRWYDGVDWNMNPDGFVEQITEEGYSIINKANELRSRIVPPLTKLFESIGGTTVREVTKALYDFLCELQIKEQIEKQAAECRNNQLFTEEKELIQLWNILIDALDMIVELAGDMKIDGDGYLILLKLILGRTDIGTIPATVDQVILGSASSLRTGSVPHVYLLGVNEGVFPKNADENCIFSDSEKGILKSIDVELSPSSDELVADELFWFYKSLSTARESLTLTFSESDLVGASNTLSVAGSRVNYLLNDKEIIDYANIPFEQKVEGKSIAVKYWALNQNTEFGVALRRYFEKDETLNGVIESFNTPLEAGVSDIDENMAKEIYKGDISTSQSRIDSYVKCSFEYHCRYILNLKEKKTAVFRSNDIGTFVHAVLERFMSRITTEDGINTDIEDDEIVRLIEEIVAEYMRTTCQGMPENSPRLMQLFKRLKRTTLLLVRNILSEFKQSKFIPSFFELPIKHGAEEGIEPYEIALEDGTKLYMRGVVDRVDTYKKGKDVYVRIVDYKTGVKTFSPDDIAKGLNLQMLLYLFAIWNTKNTHFKEKIKCEGEVLPAGILYFSARAPEINIENEEDIDNVYSKADREIKRVGMLINDVDVLKAMDSELASRYIPVKLNKDGTLNKAANLRTVEEFGQLSGEIDGILNKIATEMKMGKVNAEPMCEGDDVPCRFCKMKPVCRKVLLEDEDEQ